MNFVALNYSIVVLAETHNPTILHPAFLAARGIVPVDWKTAEPPVCTPAISSVKYDIGVVFTAELSKFMVRDNAPKENTSLPELATKYVEELPHVHYTAVGINFTGYIECPNAETWAIDRFLRSGPGNDEKMKPTTVGLKLVYPGDPGVLNLGCDPGTIQKGGEQVAIPSLIINGNYHMPIAPERCLEETRNAIGLFSRRLAHFAQITETVFGLTK
ncbi:MAG: hypothetical protein AB1813_18240 [Verrucomicrobiota bacterium]